MRTNLFLLLVIFCGLCQTFPLQAHGRYMLPSHTLLSGKILQPVTLTASITNDIFHPDKPLGNNGGGKVNRFLQDLFKQLNASVILPDGSKNHDIKWWAFARQSIADFTINQPGTYRFSLVQKPTSLVTFKLKDGTPSRIFGSYDKLPDGATDIVHHLTESRVETFITLNEPNHLALKTTGVGIELAGETHPNDLFVGEKVNFQLMLNGKPLQKTTIVKVTYEGTRHRNQREPITVETNNDGHFNLNFKQAGFYLLEVEETSKGQAGSKVDFFHRSLYVTLEVFPE